MSTSGLSKELEGPRIRDKKERYEKIAERSLQDLARLWKNNPRKEKVWRKSDFFLLKMK